jgi:hypothetical protein
MIPVRRERTGFRDLSWSLHTRLYGWNAPHIDVDRLLYSEKSPVAFVEDRNEHGQLYDKGKANILALARLARKFGFAAFFHRYADDFSWHEIRPLTPVAKWHEPKRGFNQRISDTENCVWEYQVRGRTITEAQAEQIMTFEKANKSDQPERRSAVFQDLDSPDAIERDVARLSPDDLIKLYVAMRRRLGAGHEPG